MVERLDTAKGLTPLRAAIEAAEAARSGIFQEVGERIIRKCRMELIFVKISQYPCGFDLAVVDFLGGCLSHYWEVAHHNLHRYGSNMF